MIFKMKYTKSYERKCSHSLDGLADVSHIGLSINRCWKKYTRL